MSLYGESRAGRAHLPDSSLWSANIELHKQGEAADRSSYYNRACVTHCIPQMHQRAFWPGASLCSVVAAVPLSGGVWGEWWGQQRKSLQLLFPPFRTSHLNAACPQEETICVSPHTLTVLPAGLLKEVPQQQGLVDCRGADFPGYHWWNLIQSELDGAIRNENLYQEISQQPAAKRLERWSDQYQVKLKKLKGQYRKVKDDNSRSGDSRTTWR